MRKIILVVIACVLTMCGTGMVSAAETIVDETTTVGSDEYLYYSAIFYEGATITVSVSTDGAPIDVFLMDAQDFDEYEDERSDYIQYYVDGSALKIVKKRYTWVVPETNTYYIVIDNTIAPDAGANPSRSVNVKVAITGEEAPGFGAILSFVGLLTAMMYIGRRRK